MFAERISVFALVVLLVVAFVGCVSVNRIGAFDGRLQSPEELRCEYRVDPLGIDVVQPRLSWIVESHSRNQHQSAYQILVSTSKDKLRKGQADLWDSGRVESNQTVHVVYGGEPLTSGIKCFWKVRVWTQDGKASRYSKPGTWEMALLSKRDWTGKWIDDGKSSPQDDEDLYKEDPAPLFRREFILPKTIKKARLYISGIGYYEASLNGLRIGDSFLEPGWTAYSKRVFYNTYDVTDLVDKGENCLGVTLGNGWFNPLPMLMWGHLNLRQHLTLGRPRFIAQLNIDFADGSTQTLVSDEKWHVTDGPIRSNNIYLGEVYDARHELPGWDSPGFNASDWRQASPVTDQLGELRTEPQPPVKVTATLKPVAITEPEPGVYIFDMGQNFAGWVNLNVCAPAGTKVQLRYGELLHEDGTLNALTGVCGQIKGKRTTEDGTEYNVGGPGSPEIAWQSDTYIAKGDGLESYTPRFTFHAFRYVEMTGYPETPDEDTITGLRLNSSVEQIGSFSCSNELLNKIQEMCQWTFLSNLFSVQSDCPHRERFGYGGDIAATSDAFMLNYDMEGFYSKTVRDWADSAREDGMFTDTAPFVGILYCGVGWAMAHPLLQWQLHQYHGNKGLIEEQYASSKRWFDLVTSQNPDHIMKDGLSDHEGLEPAPPSGMITPLYFNSARLMSNLAGILGRNDDMVKYDRLAAEIKDAYVEKFVDLESGTVAPDTQASHSFALYLDLLPAELRTKAIDRLLSDIHDRHNGHLSTGIFGTKYMLDVLSREGRADVAYDIVNKGAYPGWSHMLDNGATTLWEHWALSEDTFSHNHPMFGSVSEWFFKWLGGIQPHPEAVGFDRIIIRPQIIDDLDWVKSSYRSVHGQIVSNWKRSGDKLHMDVTVPQNTIAEIHVPASSPEKVMEGRIRRIPATKVKGVHDFYMGEDTAVLIVGGGTYHFRSALRPTIR